MTGGVAHLLTDKFPEQFRSVHIVYPEAQAFLVTLFHLSASNEGVSRGKL